MRIKGKNGIGNFLKNILLISLGIGGLLLVFLWPIFRWFDIEMNWFLFMIYPCGICFLMFICQFIGLFRMLERNSPFCQETVLYLKKGMNLSYIISCLVFVALFFIVFLYSYTFGVKICILFIGILFFGVGIALFILKELFQEAINYKEENDLTI